MPFVSTAALTAMQSHLDCARADLKETRAEMREARAEIARLTDTVVQMKRQGFSPPPQQGPTPEPSPLIPGKVLDAIERRMPLDSRLGRQVAAQAVAWLGGGMDESIVVHKILYGSEESEGA